MAKAVGMSRAIKIEWLNKTVEFVLSQKNEQEIANELTEYLSFEIKDKTNLKKTKSILMNIWVNGTIDKEIKAIALQAIQKNNINSTAIHWCMMLLSYPIFSDVCGMIGKIANIQDDFTMPWLKEKLFEIWGERTTLLYASEKVVQTLKQIGVIESLGKGKYKIIQYRIENEQITELILLTLLKMKFKAYYEITEISTIPQMFPFKFSVSHEWLHNSEFFTLNNFGGKIVLTID